MQKKRAPQAAGVLIAVGALAGLVWGFASGEPSWGVLVGSLTGGALVLLLWLVDSRR